MDSRRQVQPNIAHGPKVAKDGPVKQAIANAGLELFARSGFASKQGLYTYILQQSADHLLQSMDPGESSIDISAIQRLEAGIASFLRLCQENKAEVQLIFGAWFGGELPPEGPSMVDVYENMVERVMGLLQVGIDSAEFRTLDVWEASQALIGIMTNFVARMLIGNETFDPVVHSQKTVELLVKGLEDKT